jgi:hypothetical protein
VLVVVTARSSPLALAVTFRYCLMAFGTNAKGHATSRKRRVRDRNRRAFPLFRAHFAEEARDYVARTATRRVDVPTGVEHGIPWRRVRTLGAHSQALHIPFTAGTQVRGRDCDGSGRSRRT